MTTQSGQVRVRKERTATTSRFCAGWLVALTALVLGAAPAYGQAAADVQKQSQNPVGTIISFPVQWNGMPKSGPDSERKTKTPPGSTPVPTLPTDERAKEF